MVLGGSLQSLPAKLAGTQPPQDRPIDGLDIWPLLFGTGIVDRDTFFYYRGQTLCAARVGPWKAHYITRAAYGAGKPETHDPPFLFHLGRDPSERFDLAAENPHVLARIAAAVERHRATVEPAPSQLLDVAPKE